MKAKKNETWRHRYLRILTGRTDDDFSSQEDLQAIEDLIEDKMLRGEVIRGLQGIVDGAALVRSDDGHTVPTTKGRLFIEDQKAYLRSKTFIGSLKSGWLMYGILIMGWVLGLLTPLAQERLKNWIHPNIKAFPSGDHVIRP